MTYQTLILTMQKNTQTKSTSSPADSLASRSAWLETAREQMTTAICSLKLLRRLRLYNRDGCFLRTSPAYSPATPLLKFTPRSTSSGIVANPHWCLEVLIVETFIAEREYGYTLPTPLVVDATVGRIIGKQDKVIVLKSGKPRKITRNGHKGSLGLTATMAFFTLPTSIANESKGASRKRYPGSPHYRGAKTSEALRTCWKDPAYLNPYFGEWLMNYPPGASNSKPLVMDKTPL